jgi:hypothetical protein
MGGSIFEWVELVVACGTEIGFVLLMFAEVGGVERWFGL